MLDRIAFHSGDKVNWQSTVLRLQLQSLLQKSKRPQHPSGLLGVSLRARAAPNRKINRSSVTAQRPPLTFNFSSDIHRLDRMGFLSSSNFTAAHIPATTVSMRQDLNGGNTLRMAAHVNRPFASSSGWQRVCISHTYKRTVFMYTVYTCTAP